MMKSQNQCEALSITELAPNFGENIKHLNCLYKWDSVTIGEGTEQRKTAHNEPRAWKLSGH